MASYDNKETRSETGCLLPGVAITLVLILVIIGVPWVMKFNAKRSHNTEGKINLGSIYMAQQSYRQEHGVYAYGPDVFSLLRWYPEGGRLGEYSAVYAYYCGEDYLPNTRRELVPEYSPRFFTDNGPAASTTGFTCLAIGNYDQDPDLDVWSINDAKAMALIHDDTK